MDASPKRLTLAELGPKAAVAAAAGHRVEYSDGYWYAVTPQGAWSERYLSESYAWAAAYKAVGQEAAELAPA